MAEMKSIGQLMKELGFRPDAKESTAEALIRNLTKAAAESQPRRPPEEQLSFSFAEPETTADEVNSAESA